MRVLLSLVFGCFLTSGLFAQQGGSVTGKVTRAGKPVGRCYITLKSESGIVNLQTETDANGEYDFEPVAPDRYLIAARAVVDGITEVTDEQPWISVNTGSKIRIDLQLHPIINETVTIAVGDVQTVERVSKTVDLITGQEMRDRADFSLAETLRTLPGFRVQQLGGFGRTASIKSRGLRNQDTAILIDCI
jgi:outer membrane receptor protein involved in Fe transport